MFGTLGAFVDYLVDRFACWQGGHDWTIAPTTGRRYCRRCYKIELGVGRR